MFVEPNEEDCPTPVPNHVNTSVKSVKFAPLESTRNEEGYYSDNADISDFHFREPLSKIQESVRICDLDDLVDDIPIKKTSQPR